MDCRETQELLTAFHDAELSTTDGARVEEHLRGCGECRALLADLARADRAAGVPDPGTAYWDRFNARVMDRVSREAAILRPKRGWMRQQFRYLVPAAAVAALVVGIVRYGGMQPVVTTQDAPPAAGGPSAAPPAERKMAGAEPGPSTAKKAESPADVRLATRPARDGQVPMTMDGQVPRQAGTPRVSEPRPGQAAMPPVPEPRPTVVPPPADQPEPLSSETMGKGMGGAGRDAAGSVAPTAPPPSPMASRVANEGMRLEMQAERMKMAERQVAAKGESAAISPCERARALAGRKRFREAEDAQRACLSGELPDPAREKGLVFLAELLDRQERFVDADAVIAEVDRRFPQSRPLDSYRQQRPMVQKLRK